MNHLFKYNNKFSTTIEISLKLLASIIFLLLSYLILCFHEPWRDELQAFSLVRNSATLNQLLHFVQYEGHPLGWYISQRIIFFFSTNFSSIQYLNWAMLCLGVLLFIWKSPFPVLYNLAIVFGYLFLYEYAAIARNYGIAIPFFMLLCILFNSKQNWLYGIIVMITMQFSLYSFIIAFSIALGYFYIQLDKKNITYYVGILFSIIGIVLFKIVVSPPQDIGTSPGWNINPDNYTAAFSVIANAFLPIFIFDIHFWNTTIFETFLPYNFAQAVQFILSIFLFGWIIKVLYKHKLSLSIFLLGISMMMFFIASKYHGSIRHHGHIYLLFLMMLWISKTLQTDITLPFNISNKTKKRILFFPDKLISKIFVVILLSQLVGSIQAIYYEIKYPFSASQQAVNFILKKFPDQQIIGCNDDACTSVAILLNKKIYHANTGAYREHLIFNSQRGDICYDTLINRTNRFFTSNPNGLLLLSRSNATYEFISKIPYKLVYSTTEAIRHDESYLIYIQK